MRGVEPIRVVERTATKTLGAWDVIATRIVTVRGKVQLTSVVLDIGRELAGEILGILSRTKARAPAMAGDVFGAADPALRARLEAPRFDPPLQPRDGTPAARYRFMRRVHSRDGQAYCVISIYLDERVFNLAPQRFRQELVIPVLLDLPEVRIAKATQRLTIGTAGLDAARVLDISNHAPVAQIRRVFCGPDGTVIYVGELVYRGDYIRWDVDLLER